MSLPTKSILMMSSLVLITGLTACSPAQQAIAADCEAIPQSVLDADSEILRTTLSSTKGLEFLLDDIKSAKDDVSDPVIMEDLVSLESTVRGLVDRVERLSNAFEVDLDGWDQSRENTASNAKHDLKNVYKVCGIEAS